MVWPTLITGEDIQLRGRDTLTRIVVQTVDLSEASAHIAPTRLQRHDLSWSQRSAHVDSLPLQPCRDDGRAIFIFGFCGWQSACTPSSALRSTKL